MGGFSIVPFLLNNFYHLKGPQVHNFKNLILVNMKNVIAMILVLC